MMTREELKQEFWMLTKGILEDSQVDTDEARVIKRWLEEHKDAGDFTHTIALLDKLLADNWVDRFESQDIIESIGTILRTLRNLA